MGIGTTLVAVKRRNLLQRRPPICTITIVLVLVLGLTSLISGCSGIVSAGGPPPGHPAFLLNPGSIDFGSVAAGTKVPQQVSIVNSGTMPVQITALAVSSPAFSVSGATLPLAVAAGQTTNFSVWFDGKTAGKATGTLTAQAAGGAAPEQVTLTGTVPGVGVLTTLPTTVAFGNVTEGVSNSQPVQIRNTGNGSLTVSQVTLGGSGFFSVSGLAVPLVLSAGQSSSFNVLFAPQLAGSATGSLTLTSDVSSSPNTLPLSGTGVAATRTLSLSQPNISFGNVNVGGSSSQALTLTNTGNSTVTISQITKSGAAFLLAGASTPLVLSPSQVTTITVHFNPTVAGNATGNVTVSSDAAGSPANISLSGDGVVATPHSVLLNWGASTSTVSGYFIYRSTTNGSGYTKVNTSSVSSLNYTDSNVQSGLTYYYVTTAVDGSGIESIFSNQASASIP